MDGMPLAPCKPARETFHGWYFIVHLDGFGFDQFPNPISDLSLARGSALTHGTPTFMFQLLDMTPRVVDNVFHRAHPEEAAMHETGRATDPRTGEPMIPIIGVKP